MASKVQTYYCKLLEDAIILGMTHYELGHSDYYIVLI